MSPGDTQLTVEEREVLHKWVEFGVETLRDEPDSIPDGVSVPEEERNFWSFSPMRHLTYRK